VISYVDLYYSDPEIDGLIKKAHVIISVHTRCSSSADELKLSGPDYRSQAVGEDWGIPAMLGISTLIS